MQEHNFSKKFSDVYVYLFAILAMAFGMLVVQILYTLTFSVAVNINNPSIIPALGSITTDPTYLAASFIAQLLSYLLPLGLCFVILKKIFIIDFNNIRKNWLRNVSIIVISFVAIFAAGYLLTFIYDALKIEGTSENQQILEYALATSVEPILFIMTVFLAPLFEELIFRKFVMGLLESLKINKWISFIIASVIFALIHVISDPNSYIFIFQYLALSLIITLSYVKSNNNIYVSTLVHMFNNVLGFL